MRWLNALLDLIFYGNFWIALCAFAMCSASIHLLGGPDFLHPVSLFVTGGTLFIYGVHRSVGISRLKSFLAEKRYGVIYKFRKHIKIYAIFGLLLAGINFFKLTFETQILLILPCLLSLGYVLPFLSNEKRLRDINDIKIFLIAICWAGLTVALPAMELGKLYEIKTWWLIAERALFIFLITIPFDIRDLKVDSYKSVKTIPMRIGLDGSKNLGTAVFIVLTLLAGLSFYFAWISMVSLLCLMLSYLMALIALRYSHSDRHDYYYTGLIDGLMLVQALPILIFA